MPAAAPIAPPGIIAGVTARVGDSPRSAANALDTRERKGDAIGLRDSFTRESYPHIHNATTAAVTLLDNERRGPRQEQRGQPPDQRVDPVR